VLHLLEGETDRLTALLHGYNALGLATDTVKHLELEHLAGFDEIFIHQEPDHGGKSFRKAVLKRLAKLGYTGAVKIIHWPGDGIKDLNDLHCQCEPDDFGLEFEDYMLAAETVRLRRSQDESRWTPARVAEIIVREHGGRFAQFGGRLYAFRNGVYIADGDEWVRERTKEIVPGENWSNHLANQTGVYLRTGSPLLWERPPLDIVNLANGLLEVNTRRRRPYSPDYLCAVQLPVVYDPKAKCPAWEKQIADTFPDDAAKEGVAWEIVAWLMLLIMIQKALLLLDPDGNGGTGKSTFLTAASNFLGVRNVCGLSLQELEENRFATAGLVGKLANICADLPARHLETSSVFKRLTGGDRISAEHKFGVRFDFLPFVRLVFSANQPPQSRDASKAFFDRWHVLPFDTVYRGTKNEIPRKVLDARLAAPSELSGALNKALEVLPAVMERGLTVTSSMRKAHDEFWKTTDPFAAWLLGYTVADPNALVPHDKLLEAYNETAAKEGRAVMSPEIFGRQLLKLRPEVQSEPRRINHKLTGCYVGIRLRKPTDSTGSSNGPKTPGGEGESKQEFETKPNYPEDL
jgi:P4 family phage/plasmid primase-like protien